MSAAKQAEQLRELGEQKGQERHPEADRVTCNPAHQDGPIVECFKGSQCLGVYRLTGFEL